MVDSSRLPVWAAPQVENTSAGLLDTDECVRLAQELRDRAGVSRLFYPPNDLALRAGFKVAVTTARPEDELSDDRTVLYFWHVDSRERGLRIYCGLSRALLRVMGTEHTHQDVWRLALELAVPLVSRHSGWRRVSESQLHCPVNVIRDAIRGRWG